MAFRFRRLGKAFAGHAWQLDCCARYALDAKTVIPQLVARTRKSEKGERRCLKQQTRAKPSSTASAQRTMLRKRPRMLRNTMPSSEAINRRPILTEKQRCGGSEIIFTNTMRIFLKQHQRQ